jgi:hypothetical protein
MGGLGCSDRCLGHRLGQLRLGHLRLDCLRVLFESTPAAVASCMAGLAQRV